jgi:hypothetical protein
VTDALARRRVRVIKQLIEGAAGRHDSNSVAGRLHAVFPHLAPSSNDRWTDDELVVERRDVDPNASILGVGIGSARLGGTRLHRLWFDDPESDPALAASEAWRLATSDWTWGQAESRLLDGGRFGFVGTPGHPKGIMYEAETQGFTVYSFPAPGLPAHEYEKPNTAVADWPERWNAAKLAKERTRYPARRYAQLVHLKAYSEHDRFFSADSVTIIGDLGDRYTMLDSLPRSAHKGHELVIAGLDPSSGEGADDTAIIVTLLGNAVDHTLHLRRGKWGLIEIVRNIITVQRAYDVDGWAVESIAIQKWLKQALRSPEIMTALGLTPEEAIAVRILPTTTKPADKVDPQMIQGMALDFEAGKRAIQRTREGLILLDEILCWTPKDHTGDYLSALWQQEQIKRRMRRTAPRATRDTALNAATPETVRAA